MKSRKVISTVNAPAAIGPYSQAIVATGTAVFVSGQVSVDPATGSVVGSDVKTQTLQVLKNLSAVLSASGAALSDVVKTTVFLTNMDDFAQMNAVYAEFFPENPPARPTIEVCRLPLDVKVEIEAIAFI